ncbi:hypothetical protein [Nesterenkonia sp. CF4.4]|uniref:hypothetical protein n=1 Tax=Nesterenkonia sp. CF4.4 TaxID=3373079 RepID=UPI003EE65B7E
MELFLPITALIIGSVLFTMSFRMLIQANPNERIPQLWGRPARHPGRIYVIRAAAIGFLFLAVFELSGSIGYASVLLVALAGLPAWALNILHNRRVARGQHGQGAGQPA